MPDYHRTWYPGGAYFFTVNLLQRNGNDLLTRHVALLREVVRSVRQRHPFDVHAWVVLPDHLHCVIEFLLVPKIWAISQLVELRNWKASWEFYKNAWIAGRCTGSSRSIRYWMRRTARR